MSSQILDQALAEVPQWPVPAAGVIVLRRGQVIGSVGAIDEPSRIASVSKLITAYACAIAVSEGAVELSDAAGPPGSTLAHLLAHTSGYGFESDAKALTAPGVRRVYSNRGIEEAAAHIERATGIDFAAYVQEAVMTPLGMTASRPMDSPAFGFESTVTDLAKFAAELAAPTLLDPGMLADWIQVQFPGLNGIVPGVGRFDPCDWGLGFERNFGKPGHWSGDKLSTSSFGHFGGTGSFLWVDPTRETAAVCLTQMSFAEWAMQVWPPLCDAIIADADAN